MDKVLQSLICRLVDLACHELREIPWDKYGKKIKLIDEAEAKKYQGLMVMLAPSGSRFISTMTAGELADPGKSFQVVGAKIASLQQDEQSLCSIEIRNPPQVWGGAVRMDSGDLWGITGLPEVADHIAVTLVLYHLDLLSFSEKKKYLNLDNPGIAAALAYVDMDDESYNRLIRLMKDIIWAAGTRV